jgi:hypothetical protein
MVIEGRGLTGLSAGGDPGRPPSTGSLPDDFDGTLRSPDRKRNTGDEAAQVLSKIKLLFAESGIPGPALASAIRAERERLDTAFPGILTYLVGFRSGDEDLARVAAGAFDSELQTFAAVLEVVVHDEDALKPVIASLGSLSDRLGRSIDPALSTALLGFELVIIPGDGPLYVQIANRRLPHLSHEAFLEVWRDYHAPFAIQNVPPEIGMYYRQFHNDIVAAHALSRIVGFGVRDFDGAAECFYRDAGAIRDLMGRTEMVDRATEDEKTFVDHERCVTGLFDIARD